MLLDDFIGKRIKDYLIQERIGQGGMATVYRAHQASVNRDVALKIIRLDQEIAHTHEFHERFAQEAQVVAALEHLHILPVYDYGVVDSVAFLSMRWLRGGALSNLIRNGPLSLAQANYLFQQIAAGLAYAHSKGIIHRDLKTSNILLDDQGNAYLSDFGLAKILASSVGLTQSGNIIGTPIYMAPEMLRGEAFDQRSDIYSLGMVLYHMLTGRLAYDSSTPLPTLIYQVLEKGPNPPSAINAAIPQAIEAIILKALSKEVEQRYPNVEQMAQELYSVSSRFTAEDDATNYAIKPLNTPRTPQSPHTFITPYSPPTVTLPPTPARHTRRYQGLLIGAVVVAILLGGIYWFTQRDTTEPSSSPKAYATVLFEVVDDSNSVVPSQSEIRNAQTALGDKGFIAYVTCTQSTDYHAKQAREMSELAANYGLAYRTYDSNEDDYQQVTLIERARTDGAKAIILCPLNAQLLVDTLTAIEKAHVPLVLLTSDMPNYGGVKIAGDEYLMGLKAGQSAGQFISAEMGGTAKVVILDYKDIPHLIIRANGIEDGILEFAPNTTMVGRYIGGTRDNGRQSIADLLEAGVEFDFIASINDAGSFGAIEALQAEGIAPDALPIFSIDAENQAIEYIRQGYYLQASEAVDRELFSQTAINAITRLLAGGTVPGRIAVSAGEMISADNLPED